MILPSVAFPKPIENLESFYGAVCGASGRAYEVDGPLKAYDWLSRSRPIWVHFMNRDASLAELLAGIPGLRRPFSLLVPIPDGDAELDFEFCSALVRAGLRPTLEARGMEISLESQGERDFAAVLETLAQGRTVFGLKEPYSIGEIPAFDPRIEGFAELVSLYLTDNFDALDVFSRMIRDAVAKKAIRIFGVFGPDGQVVSSATLYQGQGKVAGIYHVSSAPAERGKGFAYGLVSFVSDLAFAEGARAVVLQTAMDNAARIYEKIGFRTVMRYRRWSEND